MASEAKPTRGWQAWLLWCVVPLVVGASAAFKVRDLDVWWRVKTGEWIWQHKAIPDTDPFSFTAEGPWNCVEPVANLLLYVFDALFGPTGLSVAGALMAAVLGLVAVLLARRAIGDEEPHAAPIVLAVGLFASVANFRLGPKPEVFSLWGAGLLLVLLYSVEARRNVRLLLWVPLLVLVWGWLHRGSTVAVPFLGAALVVWGIRKDTRALALPTLGALVATIVVLLLTPGMAKSLMSSANVVSNDVFTRYIGEWSPLTLKSAWQTMPFLFLMAGLWVLLAPWQRKLHFGTLIVLGTFAMAAKHVRFTPLFAIAMLPELAWGLSRLLLVHRDRIAAQLRPRVVTGLLVAVALAAVVMTYSKRKASSWGFGVDRFRRPVYAVQFLKDNPPPGNMFNTFNFGGYLLYSLAPAQKVFIDGRNDQVYSSEFFAKAAVTPGNNAVLAELLHTYAVDYAILQCTHLETASYMWIYANANWQLVYMDDQAAIMVRQTPKSEPYLRAHGYNELNPATAMRRASDPQGDPRAEAFAAEVFRHVQAVPHSIRAHHLAALLHKHAGREEAYQYERAQIVELAAERRIDVTLP